MQCDNMLSKANRPKDYDATKSVRGELITQGMESAISSGNWTIRRFRMERKGVTQVPPLPSSCKATLSSLYDDLHQSHHAYIALCAFLSG